MRIQGTALHAPVWTAGLILFTLTFGCTRSLDAEQANAADGASSQPEMPAAAKAKLTELEASLNSAQAAGDAGGEARALDAMGDLYFDISAYAQAMDAYTQGLAEARAAKDAVQDAAALNGEASCYQAQSQSDKSMETYQQALATATAANDLVGQATALNGMGWDAEFANQLQKALDFQNRALPLAQQAKDEKLEVSILRRIGAVYLRQGKNDQALVEYSQALELCRAAGDRGGEAGTIRRMGVAHSRTGENARALDEYNQALAIWREIGDRLGEAITLNNLGDMGRKLGEKQKALDAYNQALAIYQTVEDPADKGWTLANLGEIYSDLGDKQKAADFLNQAVPMLHAAGDRGTEAVELTRLGNTYWDLSQKQKALESCSAALPIFRELGDRNNEPRALVCIGIAHAGLGEKQEALDAFNQALAVYQTVDDPANKAWTLLNLGQIYSDLGEKQKAADFLNQAVPMLHAAGNRAGEAATLINLGNAYLVLNEQQKAVNAFSEALALTSRGIANLAGRGIANLTKDKGQDALKDFEQALAIYRARNDESGEAGSLASIGDTYDALDQFSQAVDFYAQALPLLRKVGNRLREAGILQSMGMAYSLLGDAQKSLDFMTQALPMELALKNDMAQAGTLFFMGEDNAILGHLKEALDDLNQAVTQSRAVGDTQDEAGAFFALGYVYLVLGDAAKAKEDFGQALPLFNQLGDRAGAAMVKQMIGVSDGLAGNNDAALKAMRQALPGLHGENEPVAGTAVQFSMGLSYLALGNVSGALASFNTALERSSSEGNLQTKAIALSMLGEVYTEQGDRQKARDCLQQALPMFKAIDSPLFEAATADALLRDLKDENPGLAIFYGKHAVNLMQKVRGNVTGLDAELQKSFLESKTDFYRHLADLLISQGRLPEAQQVLDLLKEQEYIDYVRGDATNTLGQLELTPAEQEVEEDYQRTTGQIVALGEQWTMLKALTTRTGEQEREFQQLGEQLARAEQGLGDFYARTAGQFSSGAAASKQLSVVKGEVSLLRQTLAGMPHTAALYTLVTKERLSIIVITGSTTVAREVAITEQDLTEKVKAFEQALSSCGESTGCYDPKPAARELYDILIEPVKADLDRAQAQTLVWSLDGALRYIPIAALYDDSHYVVENYATVTITPAYIAHLAEKPNFSNVSVAAMGISRQYESDLPALPAVVFELDEVVNDTEVKNARGVLPGTILLNDQFTEKAMEGQLGGQHRIVHIASHFVLQPGLDDASYLLLAGKDSPADGYHLTVADFRSNTNLKLEDTDLLTLSACQTGVSGSTDDGREVDGLAMIAQKKGAKAVISTLIEVNDASAGALMADFYKRWAGGAGTVAKVEALRQAQLDLLQGRIMPQAATSGRGVKVDDGSGAAQTGPMNYAHPYYWAAYVLMGNWM
jgi:CHAT domain-containing protein/predicted negative regulator of RcsB-dependent stress response